MQVMIEHRLIPLIMTIFTMAGCVTPPPANELISSQDLQVSGRVIILSILSVEVPPNQEYLLQIDDAYITLSFYGTSTPAGPTITGNEIRYASYVITVNPGQGKYTIDGRSYSFTEPGLYGFSRGEYAGRVQ